MIFYLLKMQLFDLVGKHFNLLSYQDYRLLADLFISSKPSDNKHILIRYTTRTSEAFYFPFNKKNRRKFLNILHVNKRFSHTPFIIVVEILEFAKLKSLKTTVY